MPPPLLAHLGGHPGAAGWGGGGFGGGGGGAGAGAAEEGEGLTAAQRLWLASPAAVVRTQRRLGAMRGSLLATVASLHRLLGAAAPPLWPRLGRRAAYGGFARCVRPARHGGRYGRGRGVRAAAAAVAARGGRGGGGGPGLACPCAAPDG